MLTANMADPSARLLRALVFCALVGVGAEATLDGVGDVIGRIGLLETRSLMARAWIASMPDAEPEAQNPEQKVTWLGAWAIARHDLKLSDDEWLDMAPRQVRALQRVRLDQLRREELMMGTIAAAACRFAVKPEEFMFNKFPAPKITAEYIAEQFRIARSKGGNV